MKFNVPSKNLQAQLTAVSKVINSKNSLSILENFLLTVSGETLEIMGSDSENTMVSTLQIFDVEGEGAIAINAKRLLDVLKEVSGQPLTFIINDETKEVDIRFLNGHFNFMGIDGVEFPRRAALDPEQAKEFTLPAQVLAGGLENTLFAVSTDPLRPIMTGVYVDLCPQQDTLEGEEPQPLPGVVFVASDTHKLVRYINTEHNPGLTGSFILPPKPASILRGLIGKEEGDVKITLDEQGASIAIADTVLSCRFIKGRYPNYNRVIPQNNPFELTIDRVSLLTAMRRVALFANSASSLVRLNIRQGEILLAAQDLDYSTSAEERLDCEYDGNVMTIGFNANYLIEVLSALDADTVVIRLSDPARPGIMTPLVQTEGQDVLMLLMPMQVMDY